MALTSPDMLSEHLTKAKQYGTSVPQRHSFTPSGRVASGVLEKTLRNPSSGIRLAEQSSRSN
jgi:hypothetical protein